MKKKQYKRKFNLGGYDPDIYKQIKNDKPSTDI